MRTILLLVAAAGVLARVHHHKPQGKAAPPIPNFPVDWTANEEDYMVVYQGQYTVSNGMYCCGDASCEVQTQYQSGMDYFDYTHNRTRFDDPVNGDIVSLFAPVYKEMAVDSTNTCTAYCPIQDDLYPYSIDANSTYMGQKVINGQSYDDWQYVDKEFGIIFETDNVFVNPSSQLPYQEVDNLTPFGQAIGQSISTYHTFTPGTPDPSHFAIKGVDNCPLDQNCGNSQRQFVRRRWNMWKTWMAAYQQNNLEKAEQISRRLQRH